MLNGVLRLGDSGNDVRILQEKLNILGFYHAIITGNFGLTTEVGVKAFQKEYGLPESGVVDEEMWRLLFSLTEVAYASEFSNYPILSLGSSGSYVRELQSKLKTLLYYTGSIDSFFGNETQVAVKRFQYHNNLTTTGIVSSQTWNALNTLYANLNACVISGEEENTITYIVKRGDTLYSIARQYNTTIDAIKSLNNLSSDILTIGQMLKVPFKESDGSVSTIYTVQAGDTLYSIAKRYNTTVDAIKSLNNLSSNVLTIGQVLKIPTTSDGALPLPTYTVQVGDTLYSIAKRYNTTVDVLKNLNNLSSNILTIGQVLKLPVTTSSTITHTVKRGDTLYSIARQYNTTVDALRRLNSLSSDILTIGQILKISE